MSRGNPDDIDIVRPRMRWDPLMTMFHSAVVHEDQTVTYCGIVDQYHIDAVRALAGYKDSSRFLRVHPRQAGVVFVLRDDGNLDWYVPVDAPEPREPDPVRDTGSESVVETEQGYGEELSADAPGAASGPEYVAGAVRFGNQSIGGAMDHPNNPPRAIWHTTESPAGANFFASMASWLMRVGSEPQIIYDPVTDRLGQFGPMTKSARAVQNDGTRRTNREGRVCIQVEALGFASAPWTRNFDPATKPNYRRLLAAMRAHGIPDTWPAGKPVPKKTSPMPRTRSTWQERGGHFGHCHVPGNMHWDPGAIDTSIVPGTPGDS